MKYWLCGFISIGLWAAEPDGKRQETGQEAQPLCALWKSPRVPR